jgi:hypothetical protein
VSGLELTFNNNFDGFYSDIIVVFPAKGRSVSAYYTVE